MVTVAQRREGAQALQAAGLSARRSCALVGLSRTVLSYQAQRGNEAAVVARLKELAQANPRYGARRIHALLRREQPVNHKRVHRLWQQAGLQVPARPKRRRKPTARPDRPPLQAERPNHVWTYDFVEDATADGRKLRLLTLEDEFTRECLAIEVARSLPAAAVVTVLERVLGWRDQPAFLRSDNGTEFTALALYTWLERREIDTHHIDLGSPWQNGYVESFNGHLRDEFLAQEEFASVAECQVLAEAWRQHYNTQRPHSRLGYLTPSAFHQAWRKRQATLEKA
jgi:putative transposase